jgi:hypothetical protein
MSFISVVVWPEFGHVDFRGAAGALPRHVDPDGDEFAEHLAHLRRGGEIAGRSEGFARRVIAMVRVEQAQRHVLGNADRPRLRHQGGDLFAQPRHAALFA